MAQSYNTRQSQKRSWCKGCLVKLVGDVLSPGLSLVLFSPQRRLDLTFEEMEAEVASKVA